MILALTRPVHRAGAAAFLATVVLFCLGSSLAAQLAEDPPKVAGQPLTAEQLAVYHAMLVNWDEREKAKVNLGVLTDPIAAPDDSLDKRCLKGLSLEAAPAGQVHRIRPEDLAQLGPFEFHLVEPKTGEKEVSDNDPGKAIQNGKSVHEAVENAPTYRCVAFQDRCRIPLFSPVLGSTRWNSTTSWRVLGEMR